MVRYGYCPFSLPALKWVMVTLTLQWDKAYVLKHQSNRIKVKVGFFVAQIARFLRLTFQDICKFMRTNFFKSFSHGKDFLILFKTMRVRCYLIFLCFNLISLALMPAPKNSLGENKLITFSKPLDESTENQSCWHTSGQSLKSINVILERN